jgi:hypothetical protein
MNEAIVRAWRKEQDVRSVEQELTSKLKKIRISTKNRNFKGWFLNFYY